MGKFPLGSLVVTSACSAFSDEHNVNLMRLVIRHHKGDWGDLCKEDKELNELALTPGEEGRIFSAYIVEGVKLYIITEWDRSYTTVMLASDY